MKPARSYANVIRRWYRAVEHECPVCQRTLRQAMTLTRRTVITLEGVIKLIHAGYRCPDRQCAGNQRIYRSAEADALALPGMTYGLDIVLLVGRLHLRQHRTVDEIHQELLERLAPLGVKISRREILYLFEAYCTRFASREFGQRRSAVAGTGGEEWWHHRRGGWDSTGQGQRNDIPGPRCLDRARACSGECDIVGDGGAEDAACASGSVGGEGAGDDHRCPGERTAGCRTAVAEGGAPGVPVPCLARCNPASL
jgi:hypothetical protein